MRRSDEYLADEAPSRFRRVDRDADGLRPVDERPIHTADLPDTPTRDRSIPARAWIEAPEALRALPDARYLRRIGPWLLWRAGPASGGDARYWAARPDALDRPVTLRLFPDGSADGTGPDSTHHTRFRSWKESLLGRPPQPNPRPDGPPERST